MRRGPVVSLLLSCLLAATGLSYAASNPGHATGTTAVPSGLYSTGFNGEGALGTGDTVDRLSPEPASVSALPVPTFAVVSAGDAHSCALTTTGVPYCWGRGQEGQLGTGNAVDATSPSLVSISALPAGTTFSAISAGQRHACALATTGVPYCWGSGSLGRLGTGDTTPRSSPTPVSISALAQGTKFSTISAGHEHTCALTTTGVPYCWGSGDSGRLGTGGFTNSTSPSRVSTSALPPGTTFSAISVGQWHTCALTTTGIPYCWGFNGQGQLGMSTEQYSPAPVSISALPAGTTFSAISSSPWHTCALTSTGIPYCWGDDAGSGRLGTGVARGVVNSPLPVSISALPAGTSFSAISTGEDHTCAITVTSVPYCWGVGSYGQLGDGLGGTEEAHVQLSPTRVSLSASATVTAVDAGRYHTMFLVTTLLPPSPALTPVFSTPVATVDGFTVAITNYDPAFTWTPSVTTGVITTGSAVGTLWPVTVSGLAPGASATLTVSTTRTGYTTGAAATSGTAQPWVPSGPDPTLVPVEAFGVGRNTEGQLADAQIIPSRPYPMPTVSGVTYEEITVGTDHACGLTSTGEAYCWGGNYYGQLGNSDVPWINDDFHPPSLVMAPGGATWSAVSAGYRYTCGVTTDGRGYCWGWNNNTRLSTVNTGSLVRAPSEVRGGYRWRSIDSGADHSCGVTTGGVVLCWGFNVYGQLGSGTSLGAYLSPTTASAATGLAHGSARRVSVASTHTCAVTNANRAYCWGYNANGQLGLGHSTSPQTSPQSVVAVAGLGTSDVASIHASPFGACAVSTSKAVYCWGYNADGQLGEGTTTSSTSPRPVTTSSGMPQGTIEHLATSTFGACAVDDSHDVWCWGDGSDGLMGDGTSAQDRVVPTQTIRLPEGVTVAAIALARYAFNPSLNPWMGCVLTTEGQPWCWRTGNNVTIARSVEPAAPSLMTPPSGRTWAQMTAGWSHSCALDTTATVWCWGDNDYGQLGSGDKVNSFEPRQVTGLGAVATISAAGSSTCALTAAGTAFCWGPNWSGELGTGDRTERLTPTPVSVSALPVQTFTAISVSEHHTCALDAVRRAWCWGDNGNGQLGTSDQIDRLSPTAVTTGAGPAPDFVQVTTNGGHTCAVDTLQRAWCWGYNGQGQLGISSTVSQSYPTLVTVSAFTSIAAGDSHTCGRSPTGVMYCWGYNISGQLGLGDTTQRTAPEPVAGLEDVAVIAAGYRRSCAAAQSGQAWCWGAGDFGTLGTASSDHQWSPTPVVTTSGMSTRAVIGFALADGHSWFLTAVQSPPDGGDSDPSEDTPAEPPSDSPTADSGPSVDPAPATVTSRLEVVAGRARAEVATPRGALQFDFRGLRDTDALTVTVTAFDDAAPPRGALAVGPRYRITVQSPFDTVEVCVPVDTALLQLTGPRRDRLRLVRTGSDGVRHDITASGEAASDPRQLCGSTDRFSDVQAVVLATERLAGVDRFGTARAVASTAPFTGTEALYVTRLDDPMAPLATVMAAGRRAPLLLTSGTRWPADTRRAVRGHAAAQVETVSGGDDLAGASAAWAVSRHPEGADIVFVASAASASDVVIAAATAAGLDAGVLLLDPQRLNTVSLEALRTLAPQRIVVIGGTTVLSAAITRQLRAVTGATVERIAGSDRTDTSLRLAQHFPRPGGVVVAGGRQLADALVAAPLAAATNANLILTGSASASDQLVDWLTRLAPPAMTLIGGDRAISPTAELRLSSTIG